MQQTSDYPVACVSMPCPRASIMRDGYKIAVTPGRILVVSILVHWTLQSSQPVLDAVLVLGRHR